MIRAIVAGEDVKAGLRAVVVSGPLVGALVVLAATVWAGGGVVGMTGAIVATAMGVGAVLGGVGEGLVRLRYPAGALALRGAGRAVLESTLVCLALFAGYVAWGMAESPQLYAARWYARGGIARTAQVVATDVLGVWGVVGIVFVLAVIYARPRRVVEVGRRLWRGTAVRVATRMAAVSMVAVGASGSAGAGASASASASAGAGAGVGVGVRASAEADARADASADAGADAGAGAGVKRPNVLLIAVPGLRADRVDARVAPELVRLGERGTRFDRAYASSRETLVSSVTMLTGREAHRHANHAAASPSSARSANPVDHGVVAATASSPRELDAMPSRFAKAGYATRVISDEAGGAFARGDLGFQHADVPSLDSAQEARAEALLRLTPLLPFLQSRLGRMVFPEMRAVRAAADPRLVAGDVDSALRAMKDQPFFLGVGLSTVRAPFAVPAPYYARFTDPRYRGRFKYGADGLDDGAPLEASDVKQVRGLYDGAVNAVDDAIARMLRSLEREGLARDTVVVVTSPHGTALFEREHGDGLAGDEGVHVPLVVHDPRPGQSGQRRRVAGVVRDVDLAPTLYELAGITPPADLDGRSLAPAMRGAVLEPRFAFAETQPRAGDLLGRVAGERMVRDEKWKLVYVPERAGVKYTLFDTVDDPGETRDMSASRPDEVARLRAELWPWMLRDSGLEQQNGFLVPRREANAPAVREAELAAEANEVALRLVDIADDPHVTSASSPAGHRTTSITLGAGESEGASTRRQALVAPAPTALTFRITVPARAKLTFAEGITSDGNHSADDATTFVVTAIDERSHARELHRHRLERAGTWTEASCDLSAYAGQTITLRLATEHVDAATTPDATGPLAFWGSPTLVTRTQPRVPYNVVWIAADGLRADALANVPALDALAKRGVRFTNAYAAATWSRPALLAMLGGARASELALDAHESSLFSLSARRHGIATHAFVSEPSVLADAPGGVDLGFEQTTDRRTHPADALALTHDATTWIAAHRDTRFFVFARYEADPAKVDEAVRALTKSLDDATLRERTIVIVTASHGGAGSFEASTHVPMIVVAPGQLHADREVKARVRTTDLVPTLGALLGIEDHAKVSGSSLVPLARGAGERDERPVVSEGHDARALLHGDHRLVVGAAGTRLYDLAADPGEASDLAPSRPEVVAEMRARLEAALGNAPVAGSAAATASSVGPRPVIHLRFAGGGAARRVSGNLVIGSTSLPARNFTVEPIDLGHDTLKITGTKAELAFTTSPSSTVGFDLIVDPPTTPVTWELYLDDQAWPIDGVFGGPYGLPAPALRSGITSDEARFAAQAAMLPIIDPRRDVGLFVTRERRDASTR